MHTYVQYTDSARIYVYVSIFVIYRCIYYIHFLYVHILCQNHWYMQEYEYLQYMNIFYLDVDVARLAMDEPPPALPWRRWPVHRRRWCRSRGRRWSKLWTRRWRCIPARLRNSPQLERWPVLEQLTQMKRVTPHWMGGPASCPALDTITAASNRMWLRHLIAFRAKQLTNWLARELNYIYMLGS